MEPSRLSQIDTRWSLLARANQRGDLTAAAAAQAELLSNYFAAVHKYLSCWVRDPAAADDLCQEFALRFVRGDYRHVCPEKGRFRDYLRTALYHSVDQHRRKVRGRELPAGAALAAFTPDPAAGPDRVFLDECRRDVLNRAWAALAEESTGDRPTQYDVLRRRADAPDRSSAELAEALSQEFGKPLTAANVRQMTHRARERFAVALRTVAAKQMGADDPRSADDELAELGLLTYCRPDGA